MKKEPISPATLLRQRAEELLKNKANSSPASPSDIETLRLVHELEVHQIELEMQNDELMLAKTQAEIAAHHFTDLYDFSPSGYASLSREGKILQLNLQAASLLGKERGNLINRRFGLYIAQESQANYNLFLETIFRSKGKQSCEVSITTNGNPPTYVFLKGIYAEGEHNCLLTMFDITERKQTEEQLSKREEQFRLLFENMTQGFSLNEVITDARGHVIDFRILQVNDAYEFHVGLKPADIVGKTISQVMPHVDKQQIEIYGKVALTGKPIDFSYISKTFNRHIHVRVFCPQHRKFATIFEDITERVGMEENLKTSEARYNALFNSSPMPMAINNEQQQITYLNPAFTQMYGYTLDDIPNLDVWFPKAYPDEAYRKKIAYNWIIELTHVKQSSNAFVPIEATITCKNGSVRTAMVSATPFSPAFDGEYLIVFQDITERKHAEEALKESEGLFQQFMQRIPSLIYLKDDKLRLLKISKSLADLVGQPESELLGKDSYEHFPPEFAKSAIADDMKVINQGITIKQEEVLHGRVYTTIKFPIHDVNNTVTRIAGFSIDITEHKKAEEALNARELNLLRGEDIAKIGYWTLNLNDNMYAASLGAIKIYGFETTNVSRKEIVNLILPEYINKIEQTLNDLLYENKPFALEYKIKRNNTGEIVDIFAKAEYNPDTNLLFGTVQDITERKKAESVLHDIIEKNPMSIQIVDIDGITLQVNPAHTLLFGNVPPPKFSIFDDLEQKGYGSYIARVKNGEVVHLPDIFYNPHDISPNLSDMPRWIRALIFPLKDSPNKPERFVFMHDNITERKQAEELLTKSHKQYQNLTDSITDAFFAFDNDLCYTYWNKATENITGITAKNAIGKSIKDIYPDNKDRQQVEDLIHQVFASKTQQQIVINYPGNNAYVHEITAYPSDEGASIIVKDITERKLMEEKLATEKQLLSTFIANIPDQIYYKDLQSRFVVCNPAVAANCGMAHVEDIVGKTDFDFFQPDLAKQYFAEEQSLMKSGESLLNHEETCINKTTKEVRYNLSTKVPLKNSDGKVIGLIGINKDITERKRAEETVKELSLFNKQVINSANEGIIVYDTDMKTLVWNPFMENISGFSAAEVVGHHPADLFPWLLEFGVIDTIKSTLNGITSQAMEIPFNVPSLGKSGWTSYTTAPMLNTKGEIIGAITTVTDITHSKEAEHAVQQKMDELQRFFDVTIGRELKMIELKQEINQLARQLGEEEDRYVIVD